MNDKPSPADLHEVEDILGPDPTLAVLTEALHSVHETSGFPARPVLAVVKRRYAVVVFGSASQNTYVVARSQEEAEAKAIEGFRDGSLDFDEPMFGGLDAAAESWPTQQRKVRAAMGGEK